MKTKLLFLLFFSLSLTAQTDVSKIDIVRDRWGVPHIFAKTDPEVAYGLAWAHAEDDFKTIQLSILAGKGMMGRFKGKEGASIDYVVSLLRCQETVEAHYKDLSPEFIALITSYVEAMNAYAIKHPEEVLVKGSFPVSLKEYMTMATLSLSVISGVDRVLGDVLKGKVKALETFKSAGSNAFAISGSKTTDGIPYLDINPHQPLEGPVAWYEAHLCSEDGWNIVGGLFPGTPLVSLGTNENLGWAHTVNNPDKVDVFQLEINPANKNQYKFDGQWLNLEEKTVHLKVKVGALTLPVNKKAYWSKYGATVMTEKGTFSIRYGASQDIRGLEQWYRMNKARNFSEFYKAMEMVAIPMFNTVYADKKDTIFYVSNAKLPFRAKGYDWKHTIPGNTSETLTQGFHPLKDLPQYLNPKSGYVFNTNHSPFNATAAEDNLRAMDFDTTMGYETKDNNRSTRFMELMAPLEKVSWEDFKRIKYDSQLPTNLHFDSDLDELWKLKVADYPELKTLIENLQNWDKKAEIDSKGAAVMTMVLYHFIAKYRNTMLDYPKVMSKESCLEALIATKMHFIQYFKKDDVALGEFQKLVRGKTEIPIWGMPDVLTAMYAKPIEGGKMKITQGESYIQLVKFPKDALPEIESILSYGVSTHEDSPYFANQMELYSKKQTKKMTLDKAKVRQEAVRTYHPE